MNLKEFKELINAIKEPDDTIVVVSGYEQGVTEVIGYEVTGIDKSDMAYDKDGEEDNLWAGEFETNEDAKRTCVYIKGKRH